MPSRKRSRRRFTIVRYVLSSTASDYPRAPIIVVNLPEFAASIFFEYVLPAALVSDSVC